MVFIPIEIRRQATQDREKNILLIQYIESVMKNLDQEYFSEEINEFKRQIDQLNRLNLIIDDLLNYDN